MQSADTEPQYNDPAVRYFRKSIQESENSQPFKVPRLNFNTKIKNFMSKGFLYPLWNSPKRKEYYKDVLRNYKEELQKQIARKAEDEKQNKIMDKIKGAGSIPFSDTYNDDFERMFKQFNKYLQKDIGGDTNVDLARLDQDPFKIKPGK